MKLRIFAAAVFLLLGSAACIPGPAQSPAGAAGGTYDAHMQKGREFMARKDYGRAAAEFQAAVALKPNSAQAYDQLGVCSFHAEEYDQAAEAFEKATQLDPSDATAFNNLAGAYSMRLQFLAAEEAYKKALALSPDLISANYSLGILLTNLGKSREGAAYLSRGIALDPDFLENHPEAISSYSSLSFDMKEAYFSYASAYAEAGNVEKTLAYLVRARDAGFKDWPRVGRAKEFDKVRDDPKIKKFLAGV
jgi:tetratricopeptide (TPR) repeat protein